MLWLSSLSAEEDKSSTLWTPVILFGVQTCPHRTGGSPSRGGVFLFLGTLAVSIMSVLALGILLSLCTGDEMWYLILSLALAVEPGEVSSESAPEDGPAEADEGPSRDGASEDAPSEVVAPEEEAPPEVEVDPAVARENLRKLWAATADEVHHEQIAALQRVGNYSSSGELLEFLVERSPSPLNRFLLAKNFELGEDYGESIARYEGLIGEELPPDLDLDVRFRYAVVLDDLSRQPGADPSQGPQARKGLRSLRRHPALAAGDRARLDLLIGASDIHLGRPRRGLRRISRALRKMADPSESSWMQARARSALVYELVRNAESFAIRGKKDDARLKKRMKLMASAESQVVSIIQLNEPEYVLEGLLVVADAYLRLYDELVSAPVPVELEGGQIPLYRERVLEEAEFLRKKARGFYHKGVLYADHLSWKGRSRDLLEQRRDALDGEGGG
jgi:hypothetical protein